MSIPKRHHTLAQFYLNGFCLDGKLWLYDRELDEYRQQTPRNTTVQSHYYSFRDESGERITGIESALAQIEGQASQIIEKLGARTPIDIEDRQIFSLFVALMRVRTTDFQKEVGELTDMMYKEVNKIAFATKETTEAILAEIEAETGESIQIAPEEIMQVVKDGQYEVLTERLHSLGLMFPLAEDIAKELFQMDWIVAFAPPDSSFITTDNPFTIVPPIEHDRQRGAGILTPGTQKQVPLSQSACLVILDKGGRGSFLDLDKSQVRQINRNAATNCDRFVIARDESLLRSIVRVTGVNRSKRKRKWAMRR
ncbi:MAG: DUF4238 domain-containing protein [Chloroflexi bacterium]|nr:DUF4238 domain-containing protein [Chloroflexota bacterium]